MLYYARHVKMGIHFGFWVDRTYGVVVISIPLSLSPWFSIPGTSISLILAIVFNSSEADPAK
jgi:hypothetical protein